MSVLAIESKRYQSISLPLSFIMLWSSGYIGGAISLRYAEPFMTTFLRFSLAGLLIAGFALITRAPLPRSWPQIGHMAVVGFFMQAMQFGGLYAGMKAGVPAGQSALIVGLMPVIVALAAGPWLGEHITWRQWAGLALGLAGVALVVLTRLGTSAAPLAGYAATCIALFGITAGTLYQKKFCGALDLRITGCVQMAVGAVVMFCATCATEKMVIHWSPVFVASVLWLALMNSIGALMLLYVMIRRGEATRVAGLFYLIPPVTQMMAAATLGEIPTLSTVGGFVVAMAGVYLSNKRPQLMEGAA